MKIFANKNIWKKIVIVLLVIFAVSFTIPKPVSASIGGALMKPVCELIVGIGDGVMKLLHNFVLRQNLALIRIDAEAGWNPVQVVIAVVAAIVITVTIISGIGAIAGAVGMSLASAAMIGTAILKTAATVGATTLFAAVLVYGAGAFSEEAVLPLYSLTPEEIFKGEIPLFDVNFINPTKDSIKYKEGTQGNYQVGNTVNTTSFDWDENVRALISSLNIDPTDFWEFSEVETVMGFLNMTKKKETYTYVDPNTEIEYRLVGQLETHTASSYIVVWKMYNMSSATNEGEIHAISYELQDTIAKWYTILKIMAVVGMMSVLVYVGIRIVISSTAPQKAKYKQLIGDWLIGMVLLFTMDFIMNFANVAVESITNVFASVNPTQNVAIIKDEVNGKPGKIRKYLTDEEHNGENALPQQIEEKDGETKLLYDFYNEDGVDYVEWHTDLMGAMRIKASAYTEGTDDGFIGYSIMFCVMVIYTLIFSWMYIKRVIYIAFLTIIAPLVAFTYPIDKMNDGSAQGFNTWFREYIFNLLLQPLHLLIYTILISSALDLAEVNWMYSLVAIGFIANAEKILRRLFNFSKASTPGVFGGATGAALTMTGIRWLLGHGPKGQNPRDREKLEAKDSGVSSKRAKLKDSNAFESLLAGEGSGVETNGASDVSLAGTSNSESGSSIMAGIASIGATGLEEDNNSTGGLKLTGMSNPMQNNALLIGSRLTETARDVQSAIFNNVQERNDSKRKRLKRALKDSFGTYWSKQKLRGGKMKPINIGRSLGKIAGGATAATVAGSLGLAAGIASGDVSQAFKYTGAAGLAGYKFGSDGVNSFLNQTYDEVGFSEMREQFKRTYKGEDEYKRIKNQREKYEALNDSKVMDDFQKNGRTREQTKEWIEKYGDKLISAGIDRSDWADIDKIMNTKIIKKNADGTVEAMELDNIDIAIGAAQLDYAYGGITDTDERLQKIMSDTGYSLESAENLDEARKTFSNQKNGIKIDSIDVRLQNEREKIQKARVQKQEKEFKEQARKEQEKADKQRIENLTQAITELNNSLKRNGQKSKAKRIKKAFKAATNIQQRENSSGENPQNGNTNTIRMANPKNPDN